MRRRATMLSAALVLLSVSACPASRSASSVQARLRKAFASDAFAAAYRAKRLLREGPFARMVIPKLRVDVIVAEGTTGDSLRGGAGHYVQTPFPGEDGNVA